MTEREFYDKLKNMDGEMAYQLYVDAPYATSLKVKTSATKYTCKYISE